jgi:Ca2+-binding EF-hand superfamily protein
VNREDLRRALEAQRVSELDRDELAALLKACDRGNKGYIATGKFIDQLYAFAAEGDGEAVLRRLAKAMQHSDTNLQQELARYDTSGNGKLDKTAFKRALRQLSVALSDAEIAKLLPATGAGVR